VSAVTIPRRLSRILLTILSLVVAIAVPLLSTTSAGEWRNSVQLFQSACIPLRRFEVFAVREQCDALASNQSYQFGVIIPLIRGDCPRWHLEWACLGVPER
jgi:hypothetical protein